jgi:hypothetical protein
MTWQYHTSSTVQHNTARTLRHSTIQHNTAQHSTDSTYLQTAPKGPQSCLHVQLRSDYGGQHGRTNAEGLCGERGVGCGGCGEWCERCEVEGVVDPYHGKGEVHSVRATLI